MSSRKNNIKKAIRQNSYHKMMSESFMLLTKANINALNDLEKISKRLKSNIKHFKSYGKDSSWIHENCETNEKSSK
ncbi:hypothetical protein ISS03_03975 [Patescibacteria group bacterium]|nr:hypothetical protein [Patescibacteria group bacterium]